MSGSAETHVWLLEAVDQYEQPLTRYARRLLGDLDLAADAVQHAVVAICGESRTHIGDRVAPWLFRVCRNLVVDHLRHSGREQSLTPHEAPGRKQSQSRGIDGASAALAPKPRPDYGRSIASSGDRRGPRIIGCGATEISTPAQARRRPESSPGR